MVRRAVCLVGYFIHQSIVGRSVCLLVFWFGGLNQCFPHGTTPKMIFHILRNPYICKRLQGTKLDSRERSSITAKLLSIAGQKFPRYFEGLSVYFAIFQLFIYLFIYCTISRENPPKMFCEALGYTVMWLVCPSCIFIQRFNRVRFHYVL